MNSLRTNTYLVSVIYLKVYLTSSRKPSEANDIPSMFFTCPNPIVITEAYVKPMMTALEMKPVRDPVYREDKIMRVSQKERVHFSQICIQNNKADRRSF